MPIAATSLKISSRLKSRIQRLARRGGESAHALMVRVLEEQIAREERRQRFLVEAARADAAMRRSGTGYAMEEVHAYLDARLAGRKAKRPAPVQWRG